MANLQQYGPRLFCLILLAISAWTDIKSRRIPNSITMPILTLCVIMAISDVFTSFRFVKLLFLIVCFFIGMIPGIGLGDIKLIMCVGVITSPFWVMMETAAASILVLIVFYIKNPCEGGLKLIQAIRRPFPIHQSISKNADSAVPFAAYLLAAYILIEGGKILWANWPH